MSATVPVLSALAVVSISSVHCWPSLCIPAQQILVLQMLLANNILTVQTYKWWKSSKVGQIMFTKLPFNLMIEKCRPEVTILILQLYHDVALKLVILGENRYDRNL